MAFCEKPSKLVDLDKPSNRSCKLLCFRVLIKFFSKKLQKVWHFVKNGGKYVVSKQARCARSLQIRLG